ncbi:MAG: XdhC/CoxI family protein [Chloroflexota bacterium]|jgi:xanthine dehydrogenase accessory factor
MIKDFTTKILSELLEAQADGTPVVLATVVKARGSVPRRSGAKMLVYEDGRISGTIGGGEMESRVIEEAQVILTAGHPRLLTYALVAPERGDPGVCGGEVEIYLEPYLPPATVYVVGCGHVGQAVAYLAHWLGFRVVANDDRAELASPEVMPYADAHIPGPFTEVLTQQPLTRSSYVVLVTRNVMVDLEILPHLVAVPAPYIGVMGSQRRWAHTRQLLQERGLSDEQVATFHSPIGIELQAETPEEIAVSIMAEIIKVRRG